MKTTIIYWTSTGNTEKMAALIKKGLSQSDIGQVTLVKAVRNSRTEDILESDLILLGCPAAGVEEIDTTEMAPFIEANKEAFKGKAIALFGSYSWGDGEWMETWEAMMEDMGAKIAVASLMVSEMPEGQSENDCIAFGAKVARSALDN